MNDRFRRRLRQTSGVVVVLLTAVLVACAPMPVAAPPAPAAPVREYRVSGSGAVLPVVQKLAEAYAAQMPGVRIVAESGTDTGGAISGVINGTLDLAAASRPLSEAEAGRAVTYSPFVRDALALAARRPTTVANLSTAQIRDIYAGDIKSWSKVGGADVPIILLDRDAGESLRRLAFLPLMGNRTVLDGTIQLTSTGDMLSALTSTPGAFGYTSFGIINLKRADGLRVLSIDGVAPSAESVESGQYPWLLTYGLVAHRDAPDDIRRFVDFVVGTGPSLLREFGYAGL